MPACQRMRYQIEIRYLQKGIDCSWFVLLAGSPGAYSAELGSYRRIGFQKKAVAAIS